MLCSRRSQPCQFGQDNETRWRLRVRMHSGASGAGTCWSLILNAVNSLFQGGNIDGDMSKWVYMSFIDLR